MSHSDVDAVAALAEARERLYGEIGKVIIGEA